MELIDAYGGTDDALDGRRQHLGVQLPLRRRARAAGPMHAYGKAIDINPVENPYVSGSHVSPAGRAALRSTARRPARDDPRRRRSCGRSRPIGWSWGGDWSGAKDYQHFSASGN